MKRLGRRAVSRVFAATFCALFCVALATPLRADTVSDFYRGRTLKFVSGFTPNGEYDTQLRVLGRHMARHIPGRPQIVASSMPGAGTIILQIIFTTLPKPTAPLLPCLPCRLRWNRSSKMRRLNSILSSSTGSAALSAIISTVQSPRRPVFLVLSKKCCERMRKKRRSAAVRHHRRFIATLPFSGICWEPESGWFPDTAACPRSSWRCNGARSTAFAD